MKKAVADICCDLKSIKSAVSAGYHMNTDKSAAETSSDDMNNENVWNSTEGLRRVKSSIVIKNTSDINKPVDISFLKDITINNRIPVNNVGVSKDGNTFINCPSIEAKE